MRDDPVLTSPLFPRNRNAYCSLHSFLDPPNRTIDLVIYRHLDPPETSRRNAIADIIP